VLRTCSKPHPASFNTNTPKHVKKHLGAMKLVGVQKTSLVSETSPHEGRSGQPVISRTWMPWMFASPVLNGLQGC